MPEPKKDVLGNPLTASEQGILEAYRVLEALHSDTDLSPTAKANVAEAVSALWQAVNNLGLLDERPSS